MRWPLSFPAAPRRDRVRCSTEKKIWIAAIARRLHAKVNLIPYNPVAGLEWKRPDRERCKMFQHTLKTAGITATLRTEKGSDIAAACGQLRLQQTAVDKLAALSSD